MIVLEARAGLGNRMYSIASTYYLAQKCQQDLTVLWDVDDSLGARADDLFALPEDIRLIYTTGLSVKRAPVRHLQSAKIKRGYKMSASTVLTSISILTLMKYSDGFDYLCEMAGRPELLYIESYYSFLPQGGSQSRYFDIFKPSGNVAQKAAPILEEINAGTIGLHIRRTDHEAAIEHGPLTAFQDKIEQCLKAEPSATFYLATDDKETRQQLLSAYPSKILINSTAQLTRKSCGGVIDAYIDMLCLSKCARIIGSYGSSFSQIASKLRDIPLEIIDILN